MSKTEKENRIHSFALEFLEMQQIVPNFYADQIIRGYKEGYRQAEKDLELTWEDLKILDDISDTVYAECDVETFDEEEYYQEILKRFKAQKGE